jgi:hypothetical protein
MPGGSLLAQIRGISGRIGAQMLLGLSSKTGASDA